MAPERTRMKSDGEKLQLHVLKSLQDKQRTRALYEEAFDDPQPFVDFYYREICKNNVIITVQEGGSVIAMCHLNPYLLSVRGRLVRSYYIVAVATDRRRRHEGLMTAVLQKAFALMEEEHIPFCYLLPVDTAIYEWLGFEVICDFKESAGNAEEIRKGYDIYCVRDEIYLRRQKEMLELKKYDKGEVLPEHPVIMAKVISQSSFCQLSGLPENTAECDLLTWLKKLNIYLCEEV